MARVVPGSPALPGFFMSGGGIMNKRQSSGKMVSGARADVVERALPTKPVDGLSRAGVWGANIHSCADSVRKPAFPEGFFYNHP
ncbi:hypothetical protein STPYR_10383 [uncultured Stenotrophomonas sp.]|uniref:Uncharacterized protein n=1 Tax=uncultured Stenotrophomonas sp. TaxID=165438 RepID=A0A1Y5PZK9_9GAMM|nr:hypothetical protein STPYR_10383 [uncultured Stenotrophomonas sp.]